MATRGTIGAATMVRIGVVCLEIRAEGADMVGDLFDEVSLEDFLRMGWSTDRPLERVGDSVLILAARDPTA